MAFEPGAPLMRRCDIGFFAAIACAGASAILLAKGRKRAAAAAAGAAVISSVYCRTQSQRSPQPMPSTLWWSLLLPRGRHGPGQLLALLQPMQGERILEIGPGIGVHAIPVAKAIAPQGSLTVVDVSPAMLAKLQHRALRAGMTKMELQVGDAAQLHFRDHAFDAAYLVSVLGEVPDRQAAWMELRRVLKPGGRLVVGELALDPDFVRLAILRREAEAAGFRVDRVAGGRLSYLALLR